MSTLVKEIELVLAGSGCGAGTPGGKGFDQGNTCQRKGSGGGGSGGGGGKKKSGQGKSESKEEKKAGRGKKKRLSRLEEDEAFDEWIEQGGTEGEWMDLTEGQQRDFHNESVAGNLNFEGEGSPSGGFGQEDSGGGEPTLDEEGFLKEEVPQVSEEQQAFDQERGALDEEGYLKEDSGGGDEPPEEFYDAQVRYYMEDQGQEYEEAFESASRDWSEMDNAERAELKSDMGISEGQQAFDQERGALDEEGYLKEDSGTPLLDAAKTKADEAMASGVPPEEALAGNAGETIRSEREKKLDKDYEAAKEKLHPKETGAGETGVGEGNAAKASNLGIPTEPPPGNIDYDAAFDEWTEQGGTEGEWAGLTESQQRDFHNESVAGGSGEGNAAKASNLGVPSESPPGSDDEVQLTSGMREEDSRISDADFQSAKEGFIEAAASDTMDDDRYEVSAEQAKADAEVKWDNMGEDEQIEIAQDYRDGGAGYDDEVQLTSGMRDTGDIANYENLTYEESVEQLRRESDPATVLKDMKYDDIAETLSAVQDPEDERYRGAVKAMRNELDARDAGGDSGGDEETGLFAGGGGGGGASAMPNAVASNMIDEFIFDGMNEDEAAENAQALWDEMSEEKREAEVRKHSGKRGGGGKVDKSRPRSVTEGLKDYMAGLKREEEALARKQTRK